MSVGTGVVHSEWNASETEPCHLMQIWIRPAAEDLPPAYQQVAIPPDAKRGQLCLLAGPAAGNGTPLTTINQDARVYVTALSEGDRVRQTLAPGRHAWVQVVRGEAALNGETLDEGDGAAVSDERELTLGGSSRGAEVLLFDLP
jgi:redox-sensitive bicupin YhaK (pirin superfamily)